MSHHITADGQFQSDKYPTCPAGKVPLSLKDPMARDLLWIYANRRRQIDTDFADDLEACLKADGYQHPETHGWTESEIESASPAGSKSRRSGLWMVATMHIKSLRSATKRWRWHRESSISVQFEFLRMYARRAK